MRTPRALPACLVGLSFSFVLTGCEPSTIETVLILSEDPVAIGSPRALPDEGVLVAGTLVATGGVERAWGFFARVWPDAIPVAHVLSGDEWQADDSMFTPGPEGRVAFALQRGSYGGAVTTIGIVDEDAQVVWSRDIAGVHPGVVDADVAGNIVLGAQLMAPLAVDGGEIVPERPGEGIALRLTPEGLPRVIFRAGTTQHEVRVIRRREDGSGLLSASYRTPNSVSDGQVVAFDPEGYPLWTSSQNYDVASIAPTPEGGAFLLHGGLSADTLTEIDAKGEPVLATDVEPLEDLGAQTPPHVDLDVERGLVISGRMRTPGIPYVARYDRDARLLWERYLPTDGEGSLSASFTSSGLLMATLSMTGFEEEDDVIVDGTSIVHRAYRDDVIVVIDEP